GREDEVEDDERRDDEEEHRGDRVARPQLEQQVLARERTDVGEVGHASPSRADANRSSRSGSWVATTNAAWLARSPSSRSSRRAPSSSSPLYGSSSNSRLGSCNSVRQSASRWSIPREKEPARAWRASQRPKRSSSIPVRSRRSGTR